MELVEILIEGAPVPLWWRAQQHSEELIREFMLIATGKHDGDGEHEIPRRLTALIDELTNEYAGFSEENEQRFADAATDGEESIDLRYQLPSTVGDAVRHLGAILDEADEYCRRGEHLLTLATPPDQLAFRRWFLGEFERQLAGQPPMPWPAYAAEHQPTT
jgi:hypothetical protein